MKRYGVILVTLGVLITISGCATLGLGPGPTVSDPTSKLSENGVPYLQFQYSVDDYSTALLEGPNGSIVSERELSPEKSVSGLRFRNPRSGTYKIVIKQGGESALTKEVTFEGPRLRIANVSVDWSGGSIQAVNARLRNDGDMPVRVQSGQITVRGQSIKKDRLYYWVPQNGSQTIAIESGYDDRIQITEPGDVRGQVELATKNRMLTATFEKIFSGPELEIVSVTPSWDARTLESATVRVRNGGDLSTSVSARLKHGEKTLARTDSEEVAAGMERTLTLEKSFEELYRADAPGSVEMEVVVSGEEEFKSTTFTHKFKPAQLNISSVEPVWDGNKLQKIYLTVSNEGDFDANAAISVSGPSGEENLGKAYTFYAQELETIDAEGLFGPAYTIETPGTVTLALTVEGPVKTHTYELTRNVSESNVKIRSITPKWEEGQLVAVEYTMENTGGVPADINVDVSVEEDQVRSNDIQIPAGETKVGAVKGGGMYSEGSLFSVVDGGSYTVTVAVPGETKSETKQFDGVQVSISGINADFFENFDHESKSDLHSVDFDIQNTGDVTLDYDHIEYEIKGYTRTDTPVITTVEPGQSDVIYSTFLDQITVDDGSHQLTIQFIKDGEAIASETVTVNTNT